MKKAARNSAAFLLRKGEQTPERKTRRNDPARETYLEEELFATTEGKQTCHYAAQPDDRQRGGFGNEGASDVNVIDPICSAGANSAAVDGHS